MAEVKTELLFEMHIDLDLETVQLVGATPRSMRGIGYIKGGAFEGPQLRGEVLPGGGDWLLIRADGVRVPDVRLTLRTDDGHLVYMSYQGIFRIAPELSGHAAVKRLTPRRITCGQPQSSRRRQRSMGG